MFAPHPVTCDDAKQYSKASKIVYDNSYIDSYKILSNDPTIQHNPYVTFHFNTIL